MPDVSMSGISYEIKGNADNAVKAIDRLQNSLKKLNNSLGKNPSISGFTTSMRNLSQAVDKLSGKQLDKFNQSVSRIANNASGIYEFTTAMQKLAAIDFSNLNTAAESLEKISNALKSLQTEQEKVKKFNIGDLFKADRLTGNGSKPIAYIFDSFRVGVLGIVSAIGKVLGGIVKTAVKVASGIVSAFKKAVSFIVSIPGRIKKAFVSAFNTIKTSVSNVGKAIKEWYGKSFLMKPLRDAISSARNFTKRLLGLGAALKRIAMYRLLRTAIKEVTAAFKEGIQNLYAWSNAIGGEFAANMDQMSTSLLYFKNSLGAMVAPLLNTLAPVLDYLIDKVVDLLNVINQLFARLTGATYWTKATRQATSYGDAVSGAGSAAKEAMKYLAPFDELNVLPDNSNTGGGGGSGSSSGSGMFENVETFSSEIANFADALKTAWEQGNWQEVGETIGNKLNELIEKVNWVELGETVGSKINGLFSSEYWTLQTIDFEGIGSSIAGFVNGAISEIDWSTMGSLITTKLTIIGDTIIGFFRDFDTSQFGTSINQFFTGMFNQMTSWISSKDWSQMGTTFYNKISALFSGLNVSEIASSFMTTLGTALGSAASFLGSFISPIAQDIKKYFDDNLKGENWKETATNILTWIGQGFTSIASWVDTSFITPFVNALGVGDKWEAVKDAGKKVWENFKSAFPELVSWVSTNIIEPIKTAFQDGDWASLFDKDTGIIAKIKSGLPDMAAWVVDNIINPIGNALSGGYMTYDGYTYDWVSSWENIDSSGIQQLIENALNFNIGQWIKDNIITPVTSSLNAEFWKGIFIPIFQGVQDALITLFPKLSQFLGLTPSELTISGVSTEQLTSGYDEHGVYWENPVEIPVTADIQNTKDSTTEEQKTLENGTIKASTFKDKIAAAQKIINDTKANINKATDQIPQNQKSFSSTADFKAKKVSLNSSDLQFDSTADFTERRNLLEKNSKNNLEMIADFRERVNSLDDKEKKLSMTANFKSRLDNLKAKQKRFDSEAKFNSSSNHLKSSNTTFGSTADFTGTKISLPKNNAYYDGNGRPYVSAVAKFTTYKNGFASTPTVDVRAKLVYTNEVAATGGLFKNGKKYPIQAYASGGFPGGQMFIAREAGPELVGTLKGHTAVMNNDQIVASVSAGVARAISDIQFHMTGMPIAYPTYSEDAETEEAMYRAFIRAWNEVDMSSDVYLDGEPIYANVVRRNRANTRRTGVNQLGG